jgi:hypothetical protein
LVRGGVFEKVKRLNTEVPENCGEKSEKDRGVYRRDAEFAEKSGRAPRLWRGRLEAKAPPSG